jgi:hypothetical protein
MASHDEIKKAILAVAGNPDSGVVSDLADAFASAVAALDAEPIVERRIVKAKETR